VYLGFFNLREHPFSLTPDPRFLFLSPHHEEALSHLLYGIHERKGFIEITGEVGTGKTILCRALLDRLDGTVSAALIFNSYLTEIELLQAITSDFGLTCEQATRKVYIDTLNQYLLQEFAAGRNAVVLIDEAQNLEPRVLEQLRMLSNLETERGKLVQVVLVGQPELRDKLATPQMRQLDQRIAVRFYIHSLTRQETQQYITHRLSVAGAANAATFSRRALTLIYKQCAGIPRRINLLCARACETWKVPGCRGRRPGRDGNRCSCGWRWLALSVLRPLALSVAGFSPQPCRNASTASCLSRYWH
jgi:general secretion pathway protein A